MEELTAKELELSSAIISLSEEGLGHVAISGLIKEARGLLSELDLLHAHVATLPTGQPGELRAHEEELVRLRRLLQQAVTKAKRNIEQQEAGARAQLLAQASAAVRRRQTGDVRQASSDGEQRPVSRGSTVENVSLAKEVTSSLRRSRNLLREEMERGIEASQLLAASSRHLQHSASEHENMQEESATSMLYLTRLRRRELTDRILLASALVFFFLTVVYVFLSRLV